MGVPLQVWRPEDGEKERPATWFAMFYGGALPQLLSAALFPAGWTGRAWVAGHHRDENGDVTRATSRVTRQDANGITAEVRRATVAPND